MNLRTVPSTTPHPGRRNGLLLVAYAAAAALLLHLAGRGILESPAWTIDAWAHALDERGALPTALTALRLVALGACAYLVALGAVAATLAGSRNRAARRVLVALTPRLLRPALGIVAAVALAAPAHAADRAASAPPVMVLVTSTTGVPRPTAMATTLMTTAVPTTREAPARADTPPGAPRPGTPPTMRRLPDDPRSTSTSTPGTTTAGTPSTTTTGAPAASLPPATAGAAQASTAPPDLLAPADLPPHPAGSPTAPAAAAPTTWTVARGDHFWHIAEQARGRQLGRAPTEREVDAYWRLLVAANRDRLVDPANPDLLFAGQELTLPPG
jgi:nucleoid-associated protein YgaU